MTAHARSARNTKGKVLSKVLKGPVKRTRTAGGYGLFDFSGARAPLISALNPGLN